MSVMRKTLSLVLACVALAASLGLNARAQTSAASRQKTPRFRNYKVVVRRGRVTPLDLRSHKLARLYRTLLREQQRDEGVNFAGRYTLASVGCGTGCSITAIIDARTGRAHFPVELNGWTGIVGDYDPPEGKEPWEYRAGSKLLRATGRPSVGDPRDERHGPSGIYYYAWDGARLRRVGFEPVGSYPETDPPAR
ncbi:MAG TPA: hypothetical protein VGP08_08335 [Pyrinomonadaceae bacterium]|jgi:hypothetical protein|nr:hypothetical protein [Pyrinomonadaceae bacterium]